jgi:hypothetical protein
VNGSSAFLKKRIVNEEIPPLYNSHDPVRIERVLSHSQGEKIRIFLVKVLHIADPLFGGKAVRPSDISGQMFQIAVRYGPYFFS